MGAPFRDQQALRSLSLFHLSGLLALGAFVWLAVRSRSAPAVDLTTLFGVTATVWAAIAVAWFAANHLTSRRLITALWLWAFLFRVAGFFANPVLEDDWARYLWDGREFARTGNPYQTVPAEHFAD